MSWTVRWHLHHAAAGIDKVFNTNIDKKETLEQFLEAVEKGENSTLIEVTGPVDRV